MRFKFALLFCLCIYTLTIAQEQETKWNGLVSGFLEQDHISYFDSISNTVIGQNQDETSIGLKYLLEYGNTFRFETKVRGILNYQRSARSQILLEEVFVQWRKKKWFIKLGKQIKDWGKLTGYSPGDRQNRYTYFDFLDIEREELGIWALQTRFNTKKSNFEFFVIPFFEASSFYLGESRWQPLPAFVSVSEQGQQQLPATFDISTENTVDQPIQFALAWELITGRIDWGLHYRYGINAIPHSIVEGPFFAQESGLQFRVQLEHERIQMASLTFSTYAGAFNLWGELNGIKTYRTTLNQEWTNTPYYHFILGTDRQWLFQNRPESHIQQLVQFIQLFNFHGHEYSNLELDLIFQRAILSKTIYQINYALELIWTHAWEIKHKGYYTQLAIKYSPINNLDLFIGTDLLFGPEESFFGHYRENKRLQAKLQ